jgi:hypothetical protein
MNFLRQEVFGKVQADKILLIFDNFESWIAESDVFLNDAVRLFLKAFFNSNHQIRGLFVTQMTPAKERDFAAHTRPLKLISDTLLQGLTPEAALEFARKEGAVVGLDKVSDKDLIAFFEQVYYIPQAIQSLIGYLEEEGITFAKFQREFWDEFEAEEATEIALENRLDQKVRPTAALVKRQILKLDPHTSGAFQK